MQNVCLRRRVILIVSFMCRRSGTETYRMSMYRGHKVFSSTDACRQVGERGAPFKKLPYIV